MVERAASSVLEHALKIFPITTYALKQILRKFALMCNELTKHSAKKYQSDLSNKKQCADIEKVSAPTYETDLPIIQDGSMGC